MQNYWRKVLRAHINASQIATFHRPQAIVLTMRVSYWTETGLSRKFYRAHTLLRFICYNLSWQSTFGDPFSWLVLCLPDVLVIQYETNSGKHTCFSYLYYFFLLKVRTQAISIKVIFNLCPYNSGLFPWLNSNYTIRSSKNLLVKIRKLWRCSLWCPAANQTTWLYSLLFSLSRSYVTAYRQVMSADLSSSSLVANPVDAYHLVSILGGKTFFLAS